MDFNIVKNNIWMLVTFALGTIILTGAISTNENKSLSAVEVTQPYLGEIAMFSGDFAPTGWMPCEGQLLSVTSHPRLSAILGTTFGGDGTTTFALPDLRGRVAIHTDKKINQNGEEIRVLGEKGGSESISLVLKQVEKNPSGATGVDAIAVSGTVSSIENRQESLGIQYIIAVNPNFIIPTRN